MLLDYIGSPIEMEFKAKLSIVLENIINYGEPEDYPIFIDAWTSNRAFNELLNNVLNTFYESGGTFTKKRKLKARFNYIKRELKWKYWKIKKVLTKKIF